MFSLDFPIYVYCAAGVALLAVVTLLPLLLYRMLRVKRRVVADTAAPLPQDGYPPLSVIVTSGDDAWNLPVLLPQILEQDYPAPLEVIVVEDGAGNATEEVVWALQKDYPNLYMTFVPAQSRNLSRKKLSLTLGIKAARYDSMVFTCGNCRIASPLWLRSMGRHFIDGKEMVIGYSTTAPAPDSAENAGGRRRSFDMVRTALEYLGAAMAGKPYRGDGNNLAYTRGLFYSVKGFTGSLNYVNGDDDIFVDKVATRSNCAVELSMDARVESLYKDPAHAHRVEKIQRRFTLRHTRRATELMWSAMSWLWWLWFGGSVAAIALGVPSLVPVAAVTVLSLGLCLPVMFVWRSVSAALGGRRLCLTVPWLMLMHPLRTLSLRFGRSDVKHYTWE